MRAGCIESSCWESVTSFGKQNGPACCVPMPLYFVVVVAVVVVGARSMSTNSCFPKEGQGFQSGENIYTRKVSITRYDRGVEGRA